ncbi:MAG: hypothetical protein E6R03_10215 [Hyphomicrobiaceae bacterium]|nr:MAG: hypothetical protein E6R03_10215 [Hyphomicrobiaceae bacterium]
MNVRDVLLGKVEELQKLLKSVPENQWSRDLWGKINAHATDISVAAEGMHESANYDDNAEFIDRSEEIGHNLEDFPTEPLEPRSEEDLTLEDDDDVNLDEDDDDGLVRSSW